MTEHRDPRVKVYRVGDAPPDALAAQSVAVLGYGYLGRIAALNLRDFGIMNRIRHRQDEYAVQASADGFDVVPLAVAASDDVVCVFLPDEVIPEVFARDVVPSLCTGSAVVFASGYSLAFGLAHPPDTVDVILLRSEERRVGKE